ncbi:NgoPII family restriction endonuclease [Clostridium estertheticum]|uniref:NgoPII family restriction endonuclease n=1 Tax=Clostridium estertheticum TaxID=238834 RepID=A0A7Y3SWZ0_9CLOT|nr:NgoPII family restriction endonuclease [Clostridium estertheticum]NNU76555.1 NgoPII family restriction endonuclease [Clostridium estertheticum]WBL49719.1 NgoPII family restriction endonuclease [Clostridium estertheticum]
MESNIVKALINISNYNERPNLSKYSAIKKAAQDSNSAKAMGSELESYSKDIFTDAYNIDDPEEKVNKYKQSLSYLGGSKNPPDFIIKEGAAVEVKKVESTNEIQLNSSSPTKTLKYDSDKITKSCKKCEKWTEKDMIYIIANQKKNTKIVESIWIIDAKCYVASKDVYLNVFNYIKDAIIKLDKIETVQSKEFARVVNIDSLNSTKLRIRPMWTLAHPNTMFNHFIKKDDIKKFRVYSLILKSTFDLYPESDLNELETLIENKKVTRFDTHVKDPDDKTKELDVILLKLIID